MHLPATAMLPVVIQLLLINQATVTARPRPSPQWSYTPAPSNLKCPNIQPCPGETPLVCANGNLYCNAFIVTIPRGKCSDCVESMCAKSSEDYPGDSTPTSLKASIGSEADQVTAEKRKSVSETELVERQVFGGYCQAQWECACVSFDGKGYYTKGKGGQCPAEEGAQESCNDDSGFLCIFGCRSKLLNEFTNAKCHARFPGTRAQCRSQ